VSGARAARRNETVTRGSSDLGERGLGLRRQWDAARAAVAQIRHATTAAPQRRAIVYFTRGGGGGEVGELEATEARHRDPEA
jgi:hypothetical protein